MFSTKDLYKLMIPLVIEQVLSVLVGMANVIMIAVAGEAAVSAVSLVDSINLLIIQLLIALSTGGAIVAARYLGRKDAKNACLAANQLILSTAVLSIVLTLLALLGNDFLLRIIFGDVEQAVMDNAKVYFLFTAFSFPFLAIYYSCAALFRSMGKSGISMCTSFVLNGLNMIGNAICIYGMKMGVEGIAVSTLFSRIVAAIIILVLLQSPKNVISIDKKLRFGYRPAMIKNILNIGIPTGLENSLFQMGKLILQSLIATLGTASIAGFAVASNVVMLEYLPGNAIGLGLITVVSQCIGAGKYEDAEKYTKKLIKANYIVVFIMVIVITLICRPLVGVYNLSAEAAAATEKMIWLHGAMMIIWPISFTLPNTLRSASDVRYTMVISILSMFIFRIGFSYVLVKGMHMGIMGVWIAMFIDWFCRAGFFFFRYQSGKWKVMVKN